MEISGNLIDIFNREIYPATVAMENGHIIEIRRIESTDGNFILPGLVDAHVHIESSMVTPGAFAVAAGSRGTVATVSDPH